MSREGEAMTGIDERIASHYTRGGLEETILAALAASGKDPNHLTVDDLAPVDEFHIGGREATAELVAPLGLAPDMHLLDIGSGIGGASRYLAETHRCRVTGIDLTEEYVEVAKGLARRVGLGDRVDYRQGSALALPFADGGFDGAYLLHVGMNIEAKERLFREVRRVLKPDGFFAIYDVMRAAEGALRFPLPWASAEATSFVASAAEYRRFLEAAGFEIKHERSRRDYALAFFAKVKQARAAAGHAPPLGIHLLMGPEAPQKIANLVDSLERGLIAPIELVARAA
jgi:ubiquinone/menaquinone biosynthesis C-methylase UbiE